MAGNLNDEFVEVGKVVLKEEAVLEKFNGEVADGVLAERVFITDGVILKHQWFEDGEVVKEEQYNEDGSLVERSE